MNLPRVYADFGTVGVKERMRLTCQRTLEELAQQKITLVDGLRLCFHDDPHEIDGVVSYSVEQGIWVAQLDWRTVRESSTAAREEFASLAACPDGEDQETDERYQEVMRMEALWREAGEVARAKAEADRPKAITRELLDATSDEDLVWNVLWDYICARISVEDYCSPNGVELRLSELPRGHSLIFYLGEYQAEVLNGGVAQFFGNKGLDFSRKVVESLREIGSTDNANLLEEAQTVDASVDWDAVPVQQSDDSMHMSTILRMDEISDLLVAKTETDSQLLTQWCRNNPELCLHDGS